MAQALATTYAGLSNIESIPLEQRIYDRDKEIIKFSEERVPMSRILMDRFQASGKKATSDMEVKYKSDINRQALLPMAASSDTDATLANATDGSATQSFNKLWFADKYAEYIDEGAILLARDVYYNGTAFVSAPILNSGGLANTQREAMLVLKRGTSDGTKTPFWVTRGFMAAQSGTAGTPVDFASGAYVLLQPRAIAEGRNEARIWSDTPAEEYNYCEQTLEKWGQTELSKDIVIYQDESQSERSGRKTLDLFFKKFELRLWNGRRHTALENGRRIWRSGGVDEYIENAGGPTYAAQLGYTAYDGDPTNANKKNHIIDFTEEFGAVSSQTLNSLLSDKFFWGNKLEKWWIMDNLAYTKISNAFDNKVRVQYNRELSMKYSLRITDLETSAGGVAHLVQHDLFSIYGTRNISYLLDFDYLKYMHLKNHDLMILMNVEKWLNIFEEVNYIYMNSGLQRRNPHALYKIINF